MADEDVTSGNTEGASTDANAPAPKKQRASRRMKEAPEAAAASSKMMAVGKQRRKRGENAGQAATKIADKPVTAKRKRGRPPATPAQAIANSPASAMDEMAELLQLEEENKRLRKTLSDKLRAENADLRKRLGAD